MRCVIIGMGQVGFHVAQSLTSDHEVVVVDNDEERLQRRQQELDVMTVHGDGALVSTLRDARVEASDMIVACTSDDKTNIVSCGMSKILGDPFTIARVRRTEYLESWREGRKPLGVDFMVGANYLTARAIVQHIGLPQAREIDFFASGKIQLAEFDIPEASPINGMTIRELDQTHQLTNLNFMAVFSDRGFEFPRGDTEVHAGDRLLVAGAIDTVHRFSYQLLPADEDYSIDRITIFGASEIGVLVAEILEASDYTVQLIEEDEDRAREVAEALSETLVQNHVATDEDFLINERVNESDIVISTFQEDEKNLLVSMFAKRLGARRAISVIRNNEYIQLFEDIGVDVAVNPRLLTAEEISRHTRGKGTQNIAILEHEQVEVLEIRIDEESSIAGRTIEKAVDDLPREIVFGPIIRSDQIITPRGETILHPGDHILILAQADQVTTVQDAV